METVDYKTESKSWKLVKIYTGLDYFKSYGFVFLYDTFGYSSVSTFGVSDIDLNCPLFVAYKDDRWNWLVFGLARFVVYSDSVYMVFAIHRCTRKKASFDPNVDEDATESSCNSYKFDPIANENGCLTPSDSDEDFPDPFGGSQGIFPLN